MNWFPEGPQKDIQIILTHFLQKVNLKPPFFPHLNLNYAQLIQFSLIQFNFIYILPNLDNSHLEAL